MIRITKDTPLRTLKEAGKDCRMCGSCCTRGAGFLIPDDLPRIARLLQISEKEMKEKYLDEIEMFHTKAFKPKTLKKNKPYGNCIFHDKEKQCTIHVAKPFQCIITNCGELAEQAIQWLYLNYFVNPDDPESVRQWASFLKHKEWVIEGGNLHELVTDRKRLKQILNYGVMK